MKWKSFEFHNIQSWEDGLIELNQNGLTVIEAKSETGKSVFIKCLRLGLYFEQYDTKTRKAIIRNYPENEYGDFGITLEDGTMIFFRYTPTNVVTVIGYPDGTSEKIERSNIDKVAKMLNLITCPNSLRVLNILDNESPMLYDTTDMEYNTKIMSLYLDHEDLRSRKSLAGDILARLNSTERNVKYLYSEYSAKLKEVQSNCDINRAETLLNYCKELNNQISLFDNISRELEYVSTLKIKPTTDLAQLEDIKDKLRYLNDIEKLLEYISTISTKPTISDIRFQELYKQLQIIADYDKLADLVSKIICCNKTKTLIDTSKLEKVLNAYKCLKIAEDLLVEVINNIHNLEYTFSRLEETASAIDEFKSQNKVCPLCGQIWESEECINAFAK